MYQSTLAFFVARVGDFSPVSWKSCLRTPVDYSSDVAVTGSVGSSDCGAGGGVRLPEPISLVVGVSVGLSSVMAVTFGLSAVADGAPSSVCGGIAGSAGNGTSSAPSNIKHGKPRRLPLAKCTWNMCLVFYKASIRGGKTYGSGSGV